MTHEELDTLWNRSVNESIKAGDSYARYRYAEYVAAAEREACAKVCEMQENRIVQTHPARIEFEPNSMMARKCAGAIRARGCQK